jgi:hypothetical protein
MRYFWLIFLLPLFSGCDKYVDKVKYADKIVFRKISPTNYYGSSWDENGGDPDLNVEFVSQNYYKEKTYSFTLAQDIGQDDLPYTYIFTDNSFPLLAKEWVFTLYDDDFSSGGQLYMVSSSFSTTGKENPIKLEFYDYGYEIELYYTEK